MPLHDWTRVEPSLFRDFHTRWVVAVADALNDGVLPPGFVALTEHKADSFIADVAAFRSEPLESIDWKSEAYLPAGGTMTQTLPSLSRRPKERRVVVIEEHKGVVAAVELVSPTNKRSRKRVRQFAEKTVGLLEVGVHVAIADVFPPRATNPGGLHPEVAKVLRMHKPAALPPAETPYSFLAYRSEDRPVAYLKYCGLGQVLPSVPLFLRGGLVVDVPFEQSYSAAFARLPQYTKNFLEPAA